MKAFCGAPMAPHYALTHTTEQAHTHMHRGRVLGESLAGEGPGKVGEWEATLRVSQVGTHSHRAAIDEYRYVGARQPKQKSKKTEKENENEKRDERKSAGKAVEKPRNGKPKTDTKSG